MLEHVLLDEVYLNNVQRNIISQFIQAPERIVALMFLSCDPTRTVHTSAEKKGRGIK